MKKKISFLAILALSFGLVSCNRPNQFVYMKDKVNIVTTTTMLKDAVLAIGQDNVNVTSLMGVGVDPHIYQPKASAAVLLQKADLIIINGLHLEGKMGTVISYLDPKKLLVVGDYLDKDRIIHHEGTTDPHIWFDISLWKVVSQAIGDKLKVMDVKHESEYQLALDNYLQELDTLEHYVINRSNELANKQRILVTAHDAFTYFGRVYGFEVHAIQGISTESEASVNDIQSLARLVSDYNIKAIFVENSIPKATINSVIKAAEALGHTLKIGGELYTDSLGDEKHNTETYIKMVKSNIDTIVDNLK